MNKVIIRHLFKDVFLKPMNVFWVFIIPIIAMLFVGFMEGYESTLSGMLFLPILTTCLIVVPKIIREYRASDWGQKLLSNRINSWRFTFIIPVFFFCLLILWITILILLFALIFLMYNQDGFVVSSITLANGDVFVVKQLPINTLFTQYKDPLSYVEMYFYFGYAIILGISWSFLVNAFCKKKATIMAVNSVLLLYNIFFIGLIIPFTVIQTNEVLYYFSYFSPFKYLASMNYMSMWSGQNDFINLAGARLFDFEIPFIIRDRVQVTTSSFLPNVKVLFTGFEKIINFAVPFVLISIFIAFSAKAFKWFNYESRIFMNNPCVKPVVYSKKSWVAYWSALAIILLAIGFSILCLVSSNSLITASSILGSLNYSDLNVNIQDIEALAKELGVTVEQINVFDPTYQQLLTVIRDTRINVMIENLAVPNGIDLTLNQTQYDLRNLLGTTFLTVGIVALSSWAGIFIKRLYYKIQSNIFTTYENVRNNSMLFNDNITA